VEFESEGAFFYLLEGAVLQKERIMIDLVDQVPNVLVGMTPDISALGHEMLCSANG